MTGGLIPAMLATRGESTAARVASPNGVKRSSAPNPSATTAAVMTNVAWFQLMVTPRKSNSPGGLPPKPGARTSPPATVVP